MKKPKGRNALGRGLDALIPSGPADSLSTGITEIDIDRIQPNRYQPREHFDDDALAGLADSIRENGIIQPVVLRRRGDEFQIVAGERRWRASQLAGLKRVPAVIKNVTDEKLLEVAIVENIQRQDLSAVETAKALKLLLNEHGLTQEELAKRVGMKRPTVANYLRILLLPEEMQEAVERGELDMGHARALVGLEKAADQLDCGRKAIKSGLSVRQVEQMVQEIKNPKQDASSDSRPDPNLVAAERRLQAALGSRVRIVRSAKGAGKIEIRFKTDDELDRLFEFLVDDRALATG
ncbi:MAG: ParB/RepB/Spo0J family partition protein [Acidobacteriota bacterium]